MRDSTSFGSAVEPRGIGRRELLAGALASTLVGATAVRAATDPIVLRFSHVVARDTPKGKGAEKFKELAERATAGRVIVELHPEGELYGDREEFEALQLGVVEMLAPSLAKFAQLGHDEFEIFDLPFLFPDLEAVARVTAGPLGRRLLDGLSDRGIVGLAYWNNGFKLMSAGVPLLMPADFVGLRMRIQPSRVLESEMRALGAVPQMIAFSETRAALLAGFVDGTENTPSNMATQSIDELQPWATLSAHGYLGYAVIVNAAFWAALPADLRAALAAAMREATVYADGLACAENGAALARMRAAGHTSFHVPDQRERDAWIAALKPVWGEAEKRFGAELLAAVTAAVGR
jgi:C4-dicarboxylate-binding protein DctP